MNENDKSPEEIEAEIEDAREDLGDTVAEIADRADVKKQAGKKVEEAKAKASEAKDAAAAKAKDVKEAAAGKAEELKASATAAADPRGGTGGDAGSGPTGDVKNSPEILDEGPVQPDQAVLIAAAAGFLAGLVLGRIIWR